MRVFLFGNNRPAQQIYEWLLASSDTKVLAVAEGKDHVHEPCVWEEPFRAPVVGSANELFPRYDPVDIAICARGGEKFWRETIEKPRLGVVNIHYGKLPEYRGCNPLVWAILNGEKFAWVTLHWMNETYDQGPVLAEYPMPIREKTAFDLYLEANEIASHIVQWNWGRILRGEPGKPQPPSTRYYPKSAINWERDSLITNSMNEEERDRRRRAFTFPPIQMPRYEQIGPLGGEVNVGVSDPEKTR